MEKSLQQRCRCLKRLKFILSKPMSCGEEKWRFKETMGGNYYGEHSKEVPGHGRTMQERQAGYRHGN